MTRAGLSAQGSGGQRVPWEAGPLPSSAPTSVETQPRKAAKPLNLAGLPQTEGRSVRFSPGGGGGGRVAFLFVLLGVSSPPADYEGPLSLTITHLKKFPTSHLKGVCRCLCSDPGQVRAGTEEFGTVLITFPYVGQRQRGGARSPFFSISTTPPPFCSSPRTLWAPKGQRSPS